jgi:integrase/recombinase XerD
MRVPGPLVSYADGFRSELVRLGYVPGGSIEHQVWVMAQLSRWLLGEGLGVVDVTPARIERFLADRRANGCRQPLSERALRPLLSYLRAQDVVPSPAPAEPATPVEALLQQYQRYLIEQRDLAPRTVPDYVSLARRFLNHRVPSLRAATDLQGLTGADVTAFLLSEVSRLTAGAANNCVNWMRSFLRYLHLQGLIATDLAVAVPPVASWRESRLPTTLTGSQIEALLDGCDRSQPTGIRDFAMLMLLARLGLRASEVAHLQLDDIDWRAGEVVIRGKSRRTDRLPLPVDVGEAIVAYLQGVRPRTECRRLFLTRWAPRRGIERAGVSHVVRRACERAGMPPIGAHRLRHALATNLLREGVSLPAISQVLRHRDLATTAVYAKVDRLGLQSVAQPWPGAVR